MYMIYKIRYKYIIYYGVHPLEGIKAFMLYVCLSCSFMLLTEVVCKINTARQVTLTLKNFFFVI